VPRFSPFNGVRFRDADALCDLTAPPYDVLDAHDRIALLARNPHNIAHIDLPDGRYADAAATMAQWINDGSLVIDGQPTLTRYTMTATDDDGVVRVTRGVIGALELMEPGTGDVLPHEQTTAKDVADRLELTRATEANLSPVWGLSTASGVGNLIAAAPADHLATWVDDDGVRHDVEIIGDQATLTSITSAIATSPVVIADGHHRYQVSRTYAAQRRAIDGAGPWDLTMCFIVELSPAHLTVHAIHRLVIGLSDPIVQLAPWFEPIGHVDQWTSAIGVEYGALGLVLPDRHDVTLLAPRSGPFSDTADLDSARLALACEALGASMSYHHSVKRLRDKVFSDQRAVGVLLRPVRVDQITALANDRGLMPPKSTFFSPKPRTGVVMRLLHATVQSDKPTLD
jgi:uncharacterized protein (DUF1015 family)